MNTSTTKGMTQEAKKSIPQIREDVRKAAAETMSTPVDGNSIAQRLISNLVKCMNRFFS